MENKKSRLVELLKKREKFHYIVEELFDNPFKLSEKEKENFMEEHKSDILELKSISDEIADLKWDLMTPEQQKDYLEKYSED